MKVEQIEINKTNIQNYLNIDVIAFHWAAPGACGEHGGVIFISRDGKVYHTNYVYPDYGITEDDLCDIFPPLLEFQPGIIGGGYYPPQWKDMYLGLGNYLVVHDSIWDVFLQTAKEDLNKRNREGEGVILYNTWVEVVLMILERAKNTSTKND